MFNCHQLFSQVLSNIFTELMAICEGLDFAAEVDFIVLELEFDMATVISQIISHGFGNPKYSQLLCQVHVFCSAIFVLIKLVLQQATYFFLIRWPIGLLPNRFVSDFPILEDFLLVCLALFIQMVRRFLILGDVLFGSCFAFLWFFYQFFILLL